MLPPGPFMQHKAVKWSTFQQRDLIKSFFFFSPSSCLIRSAKVPAISELESHDELWHLLKCVQLFANMLLSAFCPCCLELHFQAAGNVSIRRIWMWKLCLFLKGKKKYMSFFQSTQNDEDFLSHLCLPIFILKHFFSMFRTSDMQLTNLKIPNKK